MKEASNERDRVAKRSIIAATAMALAVAVLLGASALSSANATSAGSTESPVPKGFLTAREMPAAWAAAVEAFPTALPSGVGWPAKTPSFLTVEGELNEEGLAELTSAFYWMCAWEDVYLNAAESGDAKLQTSALVKLGEFEAIPIVSTNFPDVQVWYRAVVGPALEGDSSALKQDFESGCAFFTETKGE